MGVSLIGDHLQSKISMFKYDSFTFNRVASQAKGYKSVKYILQFNDFDGFGIEFWQKMPPLTEHTISTKISIFVQNFDFCPKFRFLSKISIFDQISIFVQNFNF